MSENELELDLSKVSISKDSIKHFFHKYGTFMLVLFVVLLAAYVRLYPSTMPITDDWAKSSVEGYYKSSIKAQVTQQFPNLPAENINTLTDQQYATYVSQNSAQINQQIQATSADFKKHFMDENGYVYMPDIDPYNWLRYAQNYLDHGYLGDAKKNGVNWDYHILAPIGGPAAARPHPIVLAYLYEFMHFFNSKITLMQSSNYFPVIFTSLAVIPIFFVSEMIAGNVAGLFAGIMMALNFALLGRTSWGHADTDVYQVLFPSFFVWFFFLAINEKNTKKKIIYAALGGLSIGLFALMWIGWWYVFDFILGTAGVYALYLLFAESEKYSLEGIKKNAELIDFLKTCLFFIIASAIFVSLFTTPKDFLAPATGPLEFTSIKNAGNADLWPNVYTTVAELNQASYSSIIDSIGGSLFFYWSLLGIAFMLFMKKEGKRKYLPYAIMIIFWYIGIFYASGKGIRFTMMLAPAMAIGIGAASGIIYQKAIHYLKGMGISPKITAAVIIVIFSLAFVPYAKSALNEVKNDIPIVDDAWYNSLTKIKMDSKPDAIINSWWDFGHHFKYLADRAVTFDGGTQNSPMAHWIGKVLLTSDETQAIGILRMLDCGSNNAFETLNKQINNTNTAIDILYSIIVLDKPQAESYLLSKSVPKDVAENVLKYTHCTPPEDYFITSGDMVGKASVWAHFGSWNFDKADVWINAKDMPRDESINYIQKTFGNTKDEATKIYVKIKSIADENEANSWIAPWPGYSGEQGCSSNGNSSVLDCNGIVIDLSTKDIKLNTDQGVKKPTSFVYAENGQYFEKKFDGGVQQSVILVKDGNGYKIELSSPEIASSLFTKLFYLEGAGTQHFTKLSQETQITGDKIIVWKVKW